MFCERCGKEIKNDANFCLYCGAKVVRREPPKPITQNCWNCGTVNVEEAKFCEQCGSKLGANKLFVRLGNELTKKQNVSRCPRCYSKNIKIYRKGYNYYTGFWGSLFGVRGAGYAGGFDANKACCHCMDCGKDWETDYDIRKL